MLFLCWVLLLSGFLYILIYGRKIKFTTTVLVLLSIVSLLIGSILLYCMFKFNEDDIAWYSLFFSPVFYLFSLYFIVLIIARHVYARHRKFRSNSANSGDTVSNSRK